MGCLQHCGRAFGLALLGLLAAPLLSAQASQPAAAAAQWDLTDLYPTPQAWRAELERVREAAARLSSYKGTLESSSTGMLRGLDAISRVRRDYLRVAVYASLNADTDIRVAANQESEQQTQSLGTLISEQTAWLAPEIISISGDTITAFVAAEPELGRRFGYFLDNTHRGAPHTLSLEAESLLAAAGNVLQQPGNLHNQFANAELKFPKITLSSGESVQLSAASYTKYRQVAQRADRKLVFDNFWAGWKNYEGTLGSMLTTQVMGDVFSARARRFDSALQSALFPDNMPVDVYRRLVSEANAALPTLHRYLKLRKRVLGISDDLQYYDNYPPLFPPAAAPAFDIDASKRITLEALKPLGEPYLAQLKRGFAGRWMSLYPAEGKRSGAYMNGSAYDVHPYVLLNHNNDFDSLSTFAHEWGHAVHSLLAHDAQPFETADYSTFIAESASIGNEMLLEDYLVANAKSREEKLYYLGNAVESIRTTFFRQVMFGEFELAMHEVLEKGQPLSGQRLSEMYCGLLRRYYGEAEGVMKIDPAYCIEWAFIPHLYYNFYVYQYATSMAGAAYMTDQLQKPGATGVQARERFLNLLRAGGSDYPYELYRKAGLDMATAMPYQALIARMNRLMDQIEALMRQR